jgi:hypothetical protein
MSDSVLRIACVSIGPDPDGDGDTYDTIELAFAIARELDRRRARL